MWNPREPVSIARTSLDGYGEYFWQFIEPFCFYRGKYLEISVIDTGAGIAYEDQDKLFKLFGFVQDT